MGTGIWDGKLFFSTANSKIKYITEFIFALLTLEQKATFYLNMRAVI